MNLKKLIIGWANKGAKIKRQGKLCDGCAFKKGTKANNSEPTIQDAAECLAFEQKEFYCHLNDGKCIGFLHAQQYTKTLNEKPLQEIGESFKHIPIAMRE